VGAAVGGAGAFQEKAPRAGKNQSSQDHMALVAKLATVPSSSPAHEREGFWVFTTAEG
jgi:hypothetical protein